MILYNTQQDKDTVIAKALTNRMLDQPLTQGIQYDEWFTNLIKLLQNNLSNFNEWYLKLLQGIPVKYDIANIEAPFMIYILQYSLKQFDHEQYEDVYKVVNDCIRLYQKGDLKDNKEWSTARSAARNASESAAWCAARSAEWNAAWSAAESAEWNAAENAAWSAAVSAAYSAMRNAAENAAWNAMRNAVWSAASNVTWSAAYKDFSEELLRIVQYAKV